MYPTHRRGRRLLWVSPTYSISTSLPNRAPTASSAGIPSGETTETDRRPFRPTWSSITTPPELSNSQRSSAVTQVHTRSSLIRMLRAWHDDHPCHRTAHETSQVAGTCARMRVTEARKRSEPSGEAL